MKAMSIDGTNNLEETESDLNELRNSLSHTNSFLQNLSKQLQEIKESVNLLT
jgi:archaellum component FlaC